MEVNESLFTDPGLARWPVKPVTKAAHTVTISSGGKKRDVALDPIVARVRAQLIDLVALHSNRNQH
jgi:hypothetical protein